MARQALSLLPEHRYRHGSPLAQAPSQSILLTFISLSSNLPFSSKLPINISRCNCTYVCIPILNPGSEAIHKLTANCRSTPPSLLSALKQHPKWPADPLNVSTTVTVPEAPPLRSPSPSSSPLRPQAPRPSASSAVTTNAAAFPAPFCEGAVPTRSAVSQFEYLLYAMEICWNDGASLERSRGRDHSATAKSSWCIMIGRLLFAVR